MKMPGRKFWIPFFLLAAWFGGKAWYFTPSVSAEETARDFTAVRADGTTFSLADLRGGPVLLDFWGSWCGPCRRESPELKRVQQVAGDRLTIVSIAIERDSLAWQRALTKDGRDWPYQVMDKTTSLKFLSGEVSSLYGVKQVPTNFFVDPDGRVLGVNVPLHEVLHAIATNDW